MDPVYTDKVPLLLACMSDDMDELRDLKLRGDTNAAFYKAKRMAEEVVLELGDLGMEMDFDEYLVMGLIDTLSQYHVYSIQFSRFEGPLPPCCESMRTGQVHAPGCPQSRSRR